jgi:hypothetical protein
MYVHNTFENIDSFWSTTIASSHLLLLKVLGIDVLEILKPLGI